MNDASTQGFARGAISFSTIVAIGAALGLLSVPFTTRMFEPSTLGRINIFGAYLTLAQVLSLVGLDQGYMRFGSEHSESDWRARLLLHCIGRSLMVCGLLALVAGVLWRPISVGVSGEARADVAVFLVCGVVGSVLFRYAQVWSRVEGDVGSFFWLTLLFAVCTKLSLVLAALFSPSYISGIYFLGGGYVLVGVLALVVLRRGGVSPCGGFSRKSVVGGALVLYSLPFLLAGLLSMVSTALVVIPVERIIGFEAVGVFSAGLSMASIVVVIQTGIQAYWSPYAFATHRTNPGALREVQQVITFVICTVGLAVMAASPLLFRLLGPEFRGTVGYFGLMIAPYVLGLCGEVGGVGLLLAKKSVIYSASQVVSATVTLAACAWLIPLIGLRGAALAMTAGALASATWRIAFARHFFRPFARPRLAFVNIALFMSALVLEVLLFPVGYAPTVSVLAVFFVLLALNWTDSLRIWRGFVREAHALLRRTRKWAAE